ncbi:ADP-forming succinate--CoA ligase subunit beta [Chloroflexota bacterium]
MKLFEFEAKNILRKYGIPVPNGKAASSSDQAEEIARKIGKPVVLKSQILVSGRGKSGGIIFANDAAEANKAASKLIGSTIKESLVRSLLIEEKLDIVEQLYASIAVDRQARTYIVLASTEGGIDIEETAQTSPDKISRYWINPEAGFSQPQAAEMLDKFGMSKDDTARFASIISILYTISLDNDAELVEINPLAKTTSGEFIAADARVIVDDNALFRHPEFGDKSTPRADDTPLEAEARKQNLSYVDLDGDIGIVGNGAGLGMASVDMVYHFGGKPANFLDIGGAGNIELPKKGIKLVLSNPRTRAVLVNILGGITRCDSVAQAIIEALDESKVKKPIVVRMMGTNEEEGVRILKEVGISSYPSMEKAVEEIVKL